MELQKSDLQKAASMLRTLNQSNQALEKRAEATRVLFQQVERGLVPVPRTLAEYEEKLAALMIKDLNIVKEAMNLSAGGGAVSFGTLEDGPSAQQTPADAARSAFNHAVMQGS